VYIYRFLYTIELALERNVKNGNKGVKEALSFAEIEIGLSGKSYNVIYSNIYTINNRCRTVALSW